MYLNLNNGGAAAYSTTVAGVSSATPNPTRPFNTGSTSANFARQNQDWVIISMCAEGRYSVRLRRCMARQWLLAVGRSHGSERWRSGHRSVAERYPVIQSQRSALRGGPVFPARLFVFGGSLSFILARTTKNDATIRRFLW